MKNLLLFLLAALSLAYPCELLANPIYMPEEPSNLQFVSIPILLVSEGVILAWFSELSLPNLIRFTGVWTLVTSSTFVLLMLAISKVTDVANFSQMSFSDARATETYAGECIFVGEIVITLIESAVLYFLLRLPKITGKEGYAPSILQSLKFSIAANAFSYTGGVMMLKVPAILLFLSKI